MICLHNVSILQGSLKKFLKSSCWVHKKLQLKCVSLFLWKSFSCKSFLVGQSQASSKLQPCACRYVGISLTLGSNSGSMVELMLLMGQILILVNFRLDKLLLKVKHICTYRIIAHFISQFLSQSSSSYNEYLQQRQKSWFSSSPKSRLQYLGPNPGLPSISEQPAHEFSLDPSSGPVDSFCLLILDPDKVYISLFFFLSFFSLAICQF